VAFKTAGKHFGKKIYSLDPRACNPYTHRYFDVIII